VSEIRYVCKETDHKWEEGDDISVLEFAGAEYGRTGKVVATENVKEAIRQIGINKCARAKAGLIGKTLSENSSRYSSEA